MADALLLTAAQVAPMMGISRRSLYDLVTLGQIPEDVVMRFGRERRSVRFSRPKLEAWLANRGLAPTTTVAAQPVSRRVVCPECHCEMLWVPGGGKGPSS